MSSTITTHTPASLTPSTPNAFSPTATVVDLPTSDLRAGAKVPAPASVKTETPASSPAKDEAGCEIKISQKKKWSLLAIFSLAFFIDVWSYSAFFVFTGPIAEDLGVPFEQQSWVITSYAVTFSAFLLLWGRVSDLYSAKPVFVYGFSALGVLNLVISFMPEKFSFFVFRAISGIAGAALIPAAFRLIVAVFEPHELGKAFTLYGMSGALANVTGIIVAGFIEYIPTHGQMSAWRWFFRLLAVVILPASILSAIYIPKPTGDASDVGQKWKRLDLPGSLSMLAGIVLLILGLTLGASDGWATAKFLVPFLLSWVLFAFFFIWEAKIPAEYALLPPSFWRIPNISVFIVFALYIYSWWSVNFLALVETYMRVHSELAIIAAVRLLPQGLAAGAITIFLTIFPQFVSSPRWPIALGTVFGIVGMTLLAQSGSQIGADYWRFVFTGGIIGSAANMVAFTGTNVGVMTSVPPEMAGVAGAVLQVSLQVGSAVALSIQAGLLTIEPGNLANWTNVQTSFYFQIGWGVVWLIGFLVFYRSTRKQTEQEKAEQGERVVAHF